MTNPLSPNPVAYRVADRVRTNAPWVVFGQRARRYEVHFNGRVIEVVRSPLLVEGFGVGVYRPQGDHTGAGFQASTDPSDTGILEAVEIAETIAAHSRFPTKRVELPASAPTGPGPEILDTKLWESPLARAEEYVAALLAAFDPIKDTVPSFGSVRVTLSETSLANSAGLRTQFADTSMDLEVAVKAFGGAEGVPFGEYWVNGVERRVDPNRAGVDVPKWAQFAQDARRAKAPPSGELPIVLPAEVTAAILPSVLGFRCTGAARLREMALPAGSVVAAPQVTIRDDGRLPWGPYSAPVDDEGTPTSSTTLIQDGATSGMLYDLLHAGAFGVPASGNGLRGITFGRRDWMHFSHGSATGPTTLVLEPGDGGTDAEIAEAARDGIWVQQLGWPIPDAISGAFGGEIRIAYRIRNGKLAEPLRGGTVGGIAFAAPGTPTMLTGIGALGSSSSLNEMFQGPTILVKSMTVAGA